MDVDEYNSSSSNTTEDVPQEHWEELFGNSENEEENDFEGF